MKRTRAYEKIVKAKRKKNLNKNCVQLKGARKGVADLTFRVGVFFGKRLRRRKYERELKVSVNVLNRGFRHQTSVCCNF